MRISTVFVIIQFSILQANVARAQFEIPAACSGLEGDPLFSLKAVAVNGAPVPPSNDVNVMPGDTIDMEVFISCWGKAIEDLDTYQASVVMIAETTEASGSILPQGWDAPVARDNCPCDNPLYPICNPTYGCVGAQHSPELCASLDVDRPDFIFHGLNSVSAMDVATLSRFRIGATLEAPDVQLDDGLMHYGGSLHMHASNDACGGFSFPFSLNPGAEFQCNDSFVCDSELHCVCPQVEPLIIHVCMDDGLFCNGFESCDAELGCQITPPPSCDDGVACTVDACDELTDGCLHSLNHAACDDGNVCTRDECTPTGCSNIDDQCGDIPTTSNWGLVILALSFLIMAKWRSIWAARNWNT